MGTKYYNIRIQLADYNYELFQFKTEGEAKQVLNRVANSMSCSEHDDTVEISGNYHEGYAPVYIFRGSNIVSAAMFEHEEV